MIMFSDLMDEASIFLDPPWRAGLIALPEPRKIQVHHAVMSSQLILDNIEDDDEYEAVADMFDQMLDAAEYDEMVAAEDVDIEEEV